MFVHSTARSASIYNHISPIHGGSHKFPFYLSLSMGAVTLIWAFKTSWRFYSDLSHFSMSMPCCSTLKRIKHTHTTTSLNQAKNVIFLYNTKKFGHVGLQQFYFCSYIFYKKKQLKYWIICISSLEISLNIVRVMEWNPNNFIHADDKFANVTLFICKYMYLHKLMDFQLKSWKFESIR